VLFFYSQDEVNKMDTAADLSMRQGLSKVITQLVSLKDDFSGVSDEEKKAILARQFHPKDRDDHYTYPAAPLHEANNNTVWVSENLAPIGISSSSIAAAGAAGGSDVATSAAPLAQVVFRARFKCVSLMLKRKFCLSRLKIFNVHLFCFSWLSLFRNLCLV
jgi:hypothetical protein